MTTPYRLSRYTGEFHDPAMESAFQQSTNDRIARQVRASLLVMIFLFLVFGGTVDYHYLGISGDFGPLLTLRLPVALVCLLLALALGRWPPPVQRTILNVCCLMLLTASILVIPLRSETINVQVIRVIVITFALYLFIPNRLPWIVFLSAYLIVGFLLAIELSPAVPGPQFALVPLGLLMPNIIGYIAALRLSRLEREQFASLTESRETNRKLQEEIMERRRLEEELRQLAQVDDLTGLNNRRWFLELASQELRHCRRHGMPLSLCMVDLDHFKSVNDQYGHAAGDRILILVASLCRQQLRDADIIGRFGGEEFIIALPDAEPGEARVIAERLRAGIENHKLPREFESRRVTVTAGISAVEADEETLDAALLRADQALYRGKREGRNRVVLAEAVGPPEDTQMAQCAK